MEAYKTKTKIKNDGEIKLDHVPFHVGEDVEIIILSHKKKESHYPLHNKPIKYINPTEPVSEKYWELD